MKAIEYAKKYNVPVGSMQPHDTANVRQKMIRYTLDNL